MERLASQLLAETRHKGGSFLEMEPAQSAYLKRCSKKNTLTFSLRWDENAKPLESFQDVRALQKHLKLQWIELTSEADEKNEEPASFTAVNPDGSPILVDQHVGEHHPIQL